MDTHLAAALAAPPQGTQPRAPRPIYEFTAEQVEALEATRAKLNLSPEELEEFNEHQRRTQALFADMADASVEEAERLAGLAWDKMKQPGTALPADAPRSLRNLGRFYERRQARHIQTLRAKVRPVQRQREHRPAETRRAASSSSTSSSDPGSDGDEPEPPPGRLCAAPWCSHPVYGPPGKIYCGTERCDQARSAERQRKRRHGDLTSAELQRIADALLAGYAGKNAFAGPGEHHALSFLWRTYKDADGEYKLAAGDDPGEFEALQGRPGCRCNGHHLELERGECVKCGLPREEVAR